MQMLALALAATSLTGLSFANEAPQAASVSNPQAAFERIADVVVGARICRSFGYEIDADGLTNWANYLRDAASIAADPAEGQSAQLEMVKTIRSKYAHIRSNYYWVFRNVNFFDEPRYRFVKTYRDRCAELANSTDVGEYFVAPAKALASRRIMAQVKAEFPLG